MTPTQDYCKRLEHALKAGNATEHTHRPALKTFLEALRPGITATNEPQRIACGSPDFIVTQKSAPVGYVEAKDIGVDLDKAEDSDQLKRYRAGLRNLILTDYLEFRLYRNGELIQSARLGKWQKNSILKRDLEGAQQVERLLQWFYEAKVPTIASPRELAERMARIARLLHDLIRQVFAREATKGDLHAQYEAFRQVLIADLSIDQFADMYAQTIAYGLFAARCNHKGNDFVREHAGSELPKTNPFLRKLFNTIAGPDLDDRVSWAVDDLAELLGRADMDAILEDFGQATRQEDPVVHFYETFLTAYDPKMRELRGVYYTPEPVVGYIVRSVDALLKRDFKLKDGLADKSKVKLNLPTPQGKAKSRQVETHRVQILDPACGTGTFLHAVVAQIRARYAKSQGLWPGYVAEHLLPRMYGFELLMAPYAVAHMKLGLQLQETGYDFAAEERLRVFLTNSLEEGAEFAGLPLFAQWLADEAAAASEVKRNVPIMVVIGNPPYSGHSANKGPWIEGLMDLYKQSPELKKPAQAKWLSDDYVKFLRFAQWRIEQTGYGILGFITNHSWLDNPTFLDMRTSLLRTFDELYVLDLHGNTKKKEVAPDGGEDKNVFDIQQGVAISLFVRRDATGTGAARIHHADLWGSRASKYAWLDAHDVLATKWRTFQPIAPRRVFIPQDEDLLAEYERGWSIVEAMNQNGDPAPGIVTTHDEFAISWTREEMIEKVERLLRTTDEVEARSIWRLCSQSQWNYARAKQELAAGDWRELVVPILYRPFDVRWTVYDRNVAVHRRERVNGHMLQPNLALLFGPSGEVIGSHEWDICFVTDHPTEYNLYRRGGNFLFPVWLYGLDEGGQVAAFSEKRPNYAPRFLEDLKSKLGALPILPEDIVAYFYAVLSAPSYRARYNVFLKRDFPRVPLTANRHCFHQLSSFGKRLIELHLMRATGTNEPSYPVAGNNRVDTVEHKEGRVYINAEQYFDMVSDNVWAFHIGGYQVAHKWLKDRKGRLLTFGDLHNYMRIVAALDETISVQREIDAAIRGWPIQ
jgi:predicted helicase